MTLSKLDDSIEPQGLWEKIKRPQKPIQQKILFWQWGRPFVLGAGSNNEVISCVWIPDNYVRIKSFQSSVIVARAASPLLMFESSFLFTSQLLTQNISLTPNGVTYAGGSSFYNPLRFNFTPTKNKIETDILIYPGIQYDLQVNAHGPFLAADTVNIIATLEYVIEE